LAEPRSEDQLVAAARAGSQEAFGELMARHKDAVFGIAFHRLGDFEEARDVTQETFVKAFSGLRRLQRPAAFPSWLCRIAEGTAIDALRRRKRALPLASAEAAAAGLARSPDRTDEALLAAQVRQALATLTERTRLAVILHYVNGYSQAEVAEFIGANPGAVKARLNRARGRLRDELVKMVEDTLKKQRPVLRAEATRPKHPNAGFTFTADDVTEKDLRRRLTELGYTIKSIRLLTKHDLELDARKARHWKENLVRSAIRRALEEGASAVRFTLPATGTWMGIWHLKKGRWVRAARLAGSGGKRLEDLDKWTGERLWEGAQERLGQLAGPQPRAAARQKGKIRFRHAGKERELAVAFNRRSITIRLG
jgi:RNA polymerase sigma-70 factor (ECF subfamily)